MRLVKHLVLLISLPCTLITKGVAKEGHVGDISFLEPTNHHKEALIADSPLKDAAIDFERTNAWIIGRSNLWKWSFATDRLEKFSLFDNIPTPDLSLEAIYYDQNAHTLWVSSLKVLFKITLEPFHVVAHTTNDAAKTIFLGKNGQDETSSVTWIKGQKIFTMTSEANQQLKAIGLIQSSILNTAKFLPDKNTLIAASDHQLLAINLNKTDKAVVVEKPIYRSQPEINQILIDETIATVVTKNALILMDTYGNIGQIIPTRFNRKLLAVEYASKKHFYLFDDGLIERFDLSNESKESWYLPQIHMQLPPKKIITLDAMVFTLNDETARIYFLE